MTQPPHEGCRTDLIRASLYQGGQTRILVAAHRGETSEAPENSLQAIGAAIEAGASFVEIDIRRTRDGLPVLLHDADLSRTTEGDGLVERTESRAVLSLRLRFEDGAMSAQTVPSLADALRLAKGRIWLMLDVKVDEPADIAAIAQVLKRANAADQVLLYDYQAANAAAYRMAMPGATTMFRTNDPEEVASVVKAYRPDVFYLDKGYVSQDWDAYLAKHGIPSFTDILRAVDTTFADGDTSALQPFLDARPDVIQTDQAKALVDLLRARGLHPFELDETPNTDCENPE